MAGEIPRLAGSLPDPYRLPASPRSKSAWYDQVLSEFDPTRGGVGQPALAGSDWEREALRRLPPSPETLGEAKTLSLGPMLSDNAFKAAFTGYNPESPQFVNDLANAAMVGGLDLGMFAGPAAMTANLGALNKAKALEQAGTPREQIWAETGWFKPPTDDRPQALAAALGPRNDALPLFHNGPADLPAGKPSGPMHYFGDKSFADSEGSQFGPIRYSYELPKDYADRLVRLDDGSATAERVLRDYISRRWGSDEARKPLAELMDSIYDDFSMSSQEWIDTMNHLGISGVSYGDEYLLPQKTISELKLVGRGEEAGLQTRMKPGT